MSLNIHLSIQVQEVVQPGSSAEPFSQVSQARVVGPEVSANTATDFERNVGIILLDIENGFEQLGGWAFPLYVANLFSANSLTIQTETRVIRFEIVQNQGLGEVLHRIWNRSMNPNLPPLTSNNIDYGAGRVMTPEEVSQLPLTQQNALLHAFARTPDSVQSLESSNGDLRVVYTKV